MNIMHFLAFYAILLFSGMIAILGWYVTTRGEWQIMPDGSKHPVGMIFKYWSLYFNRLKPEKERIQYKFESLQQLYNWMLPEIEKNLVPVPDLQEPRIVINNCTIAFYAYKRFPKVYLDHLQKLYGIAIEFSGTDKYNTYSFYKDYDIYELPEWLRSPLANCPTCFASFYGTAYYWIFMILVKVQLFKWATYPHLAVIFFWIVFCFSLSLLNTLLAKKLD